MQGQRSTVDSFPETFEFDHGSSSSNTGVDQQPFWNNMLNPVESRLPDYILAPSGTNITYDTSVIHDGRSLSGWSLGESSSSENTRNPVIHEEMKMEDGWLSSLSARSGAGPRFEDRRYEPTNTLSLESVNINLGSSHAANGPLFLQSSSCDNIPQNISLNAGYVGNGSNGGQVMEASVFPHPYKSGGSETEQIPSASGSAGPSGTAFGSATHMVEENDGRPGCSMNGRRLSCKRKAIEGASGHCSLGGSPSCFQHAENSAGQAFPAHYNDVSSLSISTSPDTPGISPPEQLNSRFEVGMRVTSDSHPALSVAGNAESSQRNFRMRINPAHQHDSVLPNLLSIGSAMRRSHAWSPHQSSVHIPFSYSMDPRPATANSSAPQIQSHIMHIPGLPRNVHSLPWNVASNSRVGSSSRSPVLSGERGAALREEANSRSISRNILEHPHPLFVPGTEMRSLAQDATNWSLANADLSFPGNIASTSRVSSSSGVHPSPASTWVPLRKDLL